MEKLLQAKIDGVWYDLPTPAPENYQYQNTNLENSYRTSTGFLKRDIIRKNVAKIFCGWDLLKEDEMTLLENLYDQESFILKCTDNFNARVEKTVYAGPLDSKARIMDTDTAKITYRTKVQMNFIEF
jgi:hypothetical protein